MMKLKPVSLQHTYSLDGTQSGYAYTVYAFYDSELGWSASVTLNDYGFKTPEDAVLGLREAVQNLLGALSQ
jgi:hypothetical protein